MREDRPQSSPVEDTGAQLQGARRPGLSPPKQGPRGRPFLRPKKLRLVTFGRSMGVLRRRRGMVSIVTGAGTMTRR
eukprot:scaffold31559_cov32-Tisochrysis_lutea.AAC.8